MNLLRNLTQNVRLGPRLAAIRGRLAGPSNQYLFDHIPRTGGTYFAGALADLVGATSENIDCGPDFPIVHADEIRRLDQFQVIVGHMRLDTVKAFHRIRPRHLISMVRDPVDQIASTYKFWRFNITEDVPHCNLAKRLTFSEFIREPELRMAVDNPITRHFFGLWGVGHLDTSETSQIMAVRMADSYAFIGVTERMDESIEAFSKIFRTRHAPRRLPYVDRNESRGTTPISIADRTLLEENSQLDYAVYRHVNETLDHILTTPEPAPSARRTEIVARWSWR